MTETLVIVGVLGLLLLYFRGSALAKTTGQNKRAECASNLRQFTLAMTLLANENDDKFPTNSTGYWAWDTPWAVGTFVESTGSKWVVMYCPGTAPRFTEALNLQFYNYAPPNYRVLGYANTLPGSTGVQVTNQNATLLPTPIPIMYATYPTPRPSERILLADATISSYGQINEALRDTYNYTQITGGYPWAHVSPHLNGRLPAGGNLGMLDGHVEWRTFAEMHVRSSDQSAIGFWW